MSGTVLWITGLPGSGKSTLADALKEIHPDLIILRMDEFEPGHTVIIDATGNRKQWRYLARKIIPNFAEVYLKCPLAVCMNREKERTDRHEAPRDIYRKGEKGWPVPGVNAPYDEPIKPDLTIDTDRTSVTDAVSLLNVFLLQRLSVSKNT
jgi:adenylylsulfate kinase-like enzyme